VTQEVVLTGLNLGTYRDSGTTLETHALDCDICFAELERGSTVFAAMREQKADIMPLLADEAAPAAKLRRYLGLPRQRTFRPRFAVVAVAAIVALAALAVWVLRPQAPDYRKLATFPQESVTTGIVRAPRMSDALRELMETGGSYFDLARYDEAESYFQAALDRDPELFEAAYFLGLSRILADEVDEAIPSLERASVLAPEDAQPKVSWVIANAYLKAGRLDDAKNELAILAEEGGEYADTARNLLKRLPR